MDNGDPERIKNNKECRNSKKVKQKKKKKKKKTLLSCEKIYFL